MKAPLKLGVAGLGTVGSGLLQLLTSRAADLDQALGRSVRVVGVSARDRNKARGAGIGDAVWFDSPVALAASPSIDVFVELIGGDEGVAREAVETALKSGKHVVTANKALLAKHGLALAKLAEKHNVALNFEAAVAGGIPVIKMLREALAANEVRRIYGILNGTCNYILTRMQNEGLAFADVLKVAQEKGYAEADPTFDIGGFDAAHKLALLTSLAFGTEVACDQIQVEGIETITAQDIEAADDLGYRIKLLGIAERLDGGVDARVSPVLVPKGATLAEVSGVTNSVAIDGDFVGTLLLVGPGAGSKPTASAVASDIVDIARGLVMPPFVHPSASLKPSKRARTGQSEASYYIRLSVLDQPGAMAAIAKRMGDENVSLESIVQRQKGAHGVTAAQALPPATVILMTHETTEDAIRKALDAIVKDGKVAEKPQLIRIVEL